MCRRQQTPISLSFGFGSEAFLSFFLHLFFRRFDFFPSSPTPPLSCLSLLHTPTTSLPLTKTTTTARTRIHQHYPSPLLHSLSAYAFPPSFCSFCCFTVSSRICANSPDWKREVIMSHPPTNSPATNSWGTVGHSLRKVMLEWRGGEK